MEHLLTDKEYSRMIDELDKVKYMCKCGHRVLIPARKNKEVCTWCGKYVFKNKQDEFRFRVKEKIRGEKW